MDIQRLFSNGVSNTAMNGIWNSVTAPVQDWLNAHPIWNWLANHPIWLLVLVILSIFLFSGLLRAIGRLTEWVWLALLRFPVKLLQWLFLGITQLLTALFGFKGNRLKAEQASQQARLADILDRLEALKQEQDELLKEVKTILAVKEIAN